MPREGARQTGMAMVVAVLPDVCLTPMGATPVPVPYPIVGWFSNCAIVAQTVRMCGRPTFTTASNVTNVTGDEAGTAGGVKSGVNKSTCESVTASSTVKAEGNHVLRHGDMMKMNNGNTIGMLIYMPGLGPVLVGAPSDDMVDTPFGRMKKNKGGTLNLLKDIAGDLKDVGVGFYKSAAHQGDYYRRLYEGDFGGVAKDFFSETMQRDNPINLVKPYYDKAMSDDPDALGAQLITDALLAWATDGATKGLGGAGLGVDAAVDGEAAQTARFPTVTEPAEVVASADSPGSTRPGWDAPKAPAETAPSPSSTLPGWEAPDKAPPGTDGLTVTAADTQPMQRPIVMAGDDAALLEAATDIKPEPGFQDIVIHADENGFAVKRNGRWVDVSVSELAAEVRSHGPPPTKGYRLVACEAGADVNGPAQQLANELGSPVWASDKPVGAPNLRSGSLTPDGESLASNSGRFREFKPGGESPFWETE